VITLAHLSALDLAPVEFIQTAAQAGFNGVGLRLKAVTDTSPGYALSSAQQVLSVKRALSETELVVNDIEFFKLTPEFDLSTELPLLDTGAELGARYVICAPYDDEPSRLRDSLSGMAVAARARGLRAVLEFFPWTPVNCFGAALACVQGLDGSPGILVDPLHFNRSGSEVTELALAPPDLLPFAQLCDAPIQDAYTHDELLYAARAHREAPGDGAIPLSALIDALPQGIAYGLEVPREGERAGPERVARLTRLARDSRAWLRKKT